MKQVIINILGGSAPLILIYLCSLAIPTIANDVPECKKFKVTFTIVYNELTLADAAKKEQEVRERFKDACEVDVALGSVDESISVYGEFGTLQWTPGADTLLYTPNVNE